jgi:general secretion pathway protein B
MSYILDALKRADAERERGTAPGLHTHHQIPSDGPHAPDTKRRLWLAGGVMLLMLAAGFWFWRASGTPPAAPMNPADMSAPNAATPAATSVASAPSTPAPPMKPALVPVAEAPPVKVMPLATPGTAKAVASTPAKSATSAPASTPAMAGVPAAPLLGELPQDMRSQIPKITITGSVYSDSPAQRLLLVNNLVLAQGGQVTPDLTLEAIQQRGSVFIFKGIRFRVMH